MKRRVATVTLLAVSSVIAASASACGGSDTTATTTSGGGSTSTSPAGGGGAGGSQGGGGSATGGGNVDVEDGYKSGTRLKQRWLEFGATRVAETIYDSKRKETCFSSEWPGGKSYCTPESSGTIVFTDSGCQTAVGQIATDPCTTPSYFSLTSYDGCKMKSLQMFKAGAKLATSPGAYWVLGGDGTCTASMDPGGYDYYAAGEPVTSSDLVEMQTSVEKASGRYAPLFLKGSDGYQAPNGAQDTKLDLTCRFYGPSGGKTGRCTPQEPPIARYYHDANCTVPELALTDTCNVPSLAFTFEEDQCSFTYETMWKLGAKVTSSPLYATSPACLPTVGPADATYYVTDGKLTLPDVPRVPDATPGREVELIHVDYNGTKFRDPYNLHDTKHGTQCELSPLFGSGPASCYPRFGSVNEFSTSPDCDPANAIKVITVNVDPAGCPKADPVSYGMERTAPQAGQCADTQQIYKLGSVYTGPMYLQGVTCDPVADPRSRYYSVGAAVPDSEFPSANAVIDP
jgi:hypothetical protein